jgi:hypothetical protein
MAKNQQGWAGFGAGLLMLSGCSTDRAPAPVAVTQVAPPPPRTESPPPPDDAEFASAQMIWGLRGGLNVAALLCNNRGLTRDYNQMLKSHRGLFETAYNTEQARFRQMHGTRWQARHDAASTRLYNGFANVTDRRRYCSQAALIASDAAAMPSERLGRTARHALLALDPDASRLISSAY